MFNLFEKRSKLSDEEQHESRFRRLEWKLNLIIGVCVLQAVLLTFVFFSTLTEWVMPSWTTIILASIVFIAFLYVFRKQVPGWIGAAGRYAFSRTIKSSKPTTTTETGVNDRKEELA